ncbi:MAG: nitronate monooxygenase [Fidelibacterota bacterium]
MQIPKIIQGGMGVAVSDWRLAKTVSSLGSLGVVSGTGIANILIARLMSGDMGGHVRRAMENFPIQEPIRKIIKKYYRQKGIGKMPFKRPPMWQFKTPKALLELTVVANFVEVFLAKENGEDQTIGLNLLEKIQFPTVASLYGAMLAGVTVVIMGAGIPYQIPSILEDLSQHKSTEYKISVYGSNQDDNFNLPFSPKNIFPGIETKVGQLNKPLFLPIVSSDILAKALIKKTNGFIDGFIIEAPTAGGHNAPPRGKSMLNDRGEPLYGDRDILNFQKFRDLNYPFWLAGGYDSPEMLDVALENGASGVQVGTAFAFCDESGLSLSLKSEVIRLVLDNQMEIRTDPLISPTGFPFKVVQLANSVSNEKVFLERERLCDIGLLRQVKKTENGGIVYYCPAEPDDKYISKGGNPCDLTGRSCLCNNLIASSGFAQVRTNGYVEPPLVTAGDSISGIKKFIPNGKISYSAKDVLNYVLDAV